MDFYEELGQIPGYSGWSSIRKIDKGWSHDTKYYIEDHNGQELLLRISDAGYLKGKQHEFEILHKISDLVSSVSKPVTVGLSADETKAYILLTWVRGEDAESVLPKLTPDEQYELGKAAGRALKAIHSIPAPITQENWATRFNRKIDRNIKYYRECGITIEHDERIISFINENRALLEDRSQTLQHGDFHAGNMVIENKAETGIIDFNRCDYGDPWEEFNRITFSVHASPAFASGQVDGYFENNPPDAFFRLMALYIFSNALSSLPWAIPYGQKEVDVMLNLLKETSTSYDEFKTYIPKWYKGWRLSCQR